jgi:peptidoglycan/LPS O-acetylase OafA/YrhL
MSSSRAHRTPYVPELDGVRGLAIAGVMALHFVGALTPTIAIERVAVKVSSYGVWGVDLFFVLSGFLITGILADAKGTSRYFRNFYLRRVLRIFPLYYGVLVVLFLALPTSALAAIDPQLIEARALQPWIWTYLTNIYLGAQQSFSIPYLSHFWSLAVEEHFYLVWPFIILLVPRRAAMATCVGLGILALATRIGLTIAYPNLLYANVLTFCRLDALCAGGWFALSARGPSPVTRERAVQWVVASGAAILALSAWHASIGRGDDVLLPLRTTMLAVFFAFFIYVVSRESGWQPVRSILSARLLRSLGKYSYGLYVYHGLVSYGMHRSPLEAWLSRVVGVHVVANGLMVTLGVGASMLLAFASYELFEVRFLALKSRFEYDDGARSFGPPDRAAAPALS